MVASCFAAGGMRSLDGNHVLVRWILAVLVTVISWDLKRERQRQRTM